MPVVLKDFGVYTSGIHSDDVERNVVTENIKFDDIILDLIGKGYRTPGTAKIVLSLCRIGVTELNGFKLPLNKAVEQLDIMEYWLQFDFDKYVSLPREEQKCFFWRMMCDSTLDIAKQLDWPIEPLDNLYERGLRHKDF